MNMRHHRPALLALSLVLGLAPTARAQTDDEPAQGEEGPAQPPEGGEAAEGGATEGEGEPWYARGQEETQPTPEATPAEPTVTEGDEGEVVDAPEISDTPEEGEGDGAAEEAGWQLRPIGLIRTGYEYVFDDPRYDFVGDNGGFILGNARVGIAGAAPDYGFSFRVNLEGAVATGGLANTPEADLTAALRDAFIRWDFLDFLGVQIGQFKVPFMAGWLGRDGALPFASRAVGLDGVPVGRGFETPGIRVDRELGLTLGSDGPVYVAGDFGIGYYVTAFNGNGINELLNDNVRPAVAGRFELYWAQYARLGAGVLWNSRTEGPLPDRFDEEDLGFSADLSVDVVGIEFVGHMTLMQTSYPTAGLQDRLRLEFHLQAGYDLPFIDFPFVVGYRFAYYDPWQSGGAGGPVDLSAFELMYHTVGLRLEHPVADLRLTAWLNYTFTIETDPRSLDNDRIEVLFQVAF